MKRNKEYLTWRNAVIERDENCVICGKTGKYLNAHHLIPKNFLLFELEIDNGITLCPHCHSFGKYSAHKNPIWFTDWLRRRRLVMFRLALERLKNA